MQLRTCCSSRDFHVTQADCNTIALSSNAKFRLVLVEITDAGVYQGVPRCESIAVPETVATREREGEYRRSFERTNE